MEKRNQDEFVWPVVGRPASSSSLSSRVRCFEAFTSPSRPRRLLSFCLKIDVDKCLEIQFDSASLLSYFLFTLLFFLRAFCVRGRDGGCVVQEQGGTGFCVLSSALQQYFLSHSHLQYLWQLNVSQEAERKESLISALSCYTYTEDC